MPKIHLLPKTYELEITLGAISTTDDPEGEISKSKAQNPNQIPISKIHSTLKKFIGAIQQIPPAYAAIKVHGKKLYEYAREGKTVERKPRLVMTYSIDLLEYQYPKLCLKVMCGSGTYMRSLARDIGERLGRGGYASALRRTAVGSYAIDQALPFSKLVLQWPNATN